MKLTYTKAHNLAQLTEELVAALPALVFVNAEGRNESRLTISGDGAAITIEVPDGTNQASVAAVVNAHAVNVNHGRDTLYENAVQYLNNTIRPKLIQSPPVALTAGEQTRFNQATLVVMSRLRREVLS